MLLTAQVGIVFPTTALPPLPIPCDANIVGGELYFQGLDVGLQAAARVLSTIA